MNDTPEDTSPAPRLKWMRPEEETYPSFTLTPPDLAKQNTIEFMERGKALLTLTMKDGKVHMEGEVEEGSKLFVDSMLCLFDQRIAALPLLLDLARAVAAEEPLAEDYERRHLYTLARRALDAAEG